MSSSSQHLVNWDDKIRAFLHDPPHKPIVLMKGKKHEEVARQMLHNLGIGLDELDKNSWKNADNIASTADRTYVEPHRKDNQKVSIKFEEGYEITHPFATVGTTTGQKQTPTRLFLENLSKNHDWLAEWNAVVARIQPRLKMLYESEDTRWLAYLLIWQYIPDQLGVRWSQLPADTRIPDHSVWLHNGLVSGVVGAAGDKMSKTQQPQLSFLRVHLPGVQDFIAQSRKMNDLWASSYIIARVMWAGVKTLVKTLGPDALLFPSLRDHPYLRQWLNREIEEKTGEPLYSDDYNEDDLRVSSVPNSLLALIPYEREWELAKRVVAAMTTEWEQLCDGVYQQIKEYFPQEGRDVVSNMFFAQTKGVFQPVWVTYPWLRYDKNDRESVNPMLDKWLAEEASDFHERMKVYHEIRGVGSTQGVLYPVLHRIGTQLLRDRRAVRTGPAVREAEGEKCTICGERNALCNQRVQEVRAWGEYRSSVTAFWEEVAEKANPSIGHCFNKEGGERLCAVCTVTRLAPHTKQMQEYIGKSTAWSSFPSTSTLATLSWKKALVARLVQADVLDGHEKIWDALHRYVQAVAEFPPSQAGKESLEVLYSESHPWNGVELGQKKNADLIRFMELDGQWLFADEFYRAKKTDECEKAVHSLQELLQAADELQIGRPAKYYALLRMDGDDVGRLIGGEREWLPQWEQVLHSKAREKAVAKGINIDPLLKQHRAMSPSIHMTVSRALSFFATGTVPEMITKHGGFLIYAGGDDLLALLPADTAMQAASELRSFYTAPFVYKKKGESQPDIIWHEATESEFLDMDNLQELRVHMGTGAKISASIVYAHHHVPIKPIMQESVRLLKQVKREEDKNCCALTIYHRNGQKVKSLHSWSQVRHFNHSIEHLQEGDVSSRFFYQVREMKLILQELTDQERQDVLVSLLLKSRAERGDREVSQADRKHRAYVVVRNLLALQNGGNAADHLPFDTNSWMMVRFLAKLFEE